MVSASAIELLLIPRVCVCVLILAGAELACRMGSGVWIRLGPSETPEIPRMAAPPGSVCRQDAEGVGSQASPRAGNM